MLTQVEVTHQTEIPGALLLAKDAIRSRYVHAVIPAEALSDRFPEAKLRHFDYATFELIARSNIDAIAQIFDEKYQAGEIVRHNRFGERPVVMIFEQDLRRADINADVVQIRRASGFW
ncbi:MAG: hypothetical protein ACTHLR_12885 [Rhizomicrobium sp.]